MPFLHFVSAENPRSMYHAVVDSPAKSDAQNANMKKYFICQLLCSEGEASRTLCATRYDPGSGTPPK